MDYKYISQEVDYMKLLYDSPDVSIYELDAIHLGLNKNDCFIDEECVKESLASFADKPLYCVIDNQLNPLDGSNNDFVEHFREQYPWRITRDRILPFGCVPESALEDAKLVERDGHIYLRMNVVVWKHLLPHVSEILQRRDGSVRVSVEFSVLEAEQLDNGVLYIHKFHITAITALGEKFKEIMEGSGLKTIKFSFNDYVKNGNTRYFSYKNPEASIIPEEVVSSISNGIDLRKKYKRGGTKAVFERTLKMCESGIATPDDIVRMQKYFSELKDIPEVTKPLTSKYIVYSMYGGEIARKWVNEVCNGSAVTIYKYSEKGGSSEVNIQIDNKKESAVESPNWSNPGKSLYGPILEASNKKALVEEAYLVVDFGWEDAPSENLKYPHHVVKGDKLILDVAGVKAAYARAAQMGIISGHVKEHLERHYRELGLPMEEMKNAMQKELDELKVAHAAKCAEFDQKCTDFDASDAARKAAEQKCADLEAALEEKCAKLAEYEKKETTSKNMAFLNEYVHCLSTDKYAELKEKACNMSCDEMKNAVAEGIMEFVKQPKMRGEDGVEDRRMMSMSFGFPAVNDYFNPQHVEESRLAQITNNSKTKVR